MSSGYGFISDFLLEAATMARQQHDRHPDTDAKRQCVQPTRDMFFILSEMMRLL